MARTGRLGDRGTAMRLSMRVWDLPVRLFHWALAALVAGAAAAWLAGRWVLHRELGEAVLVLAAWRVAWGVVGSTTARFGDFLHRRAGPGGKDDRLGNSAVTGWWLVALLAVLMVACLSGFSPRLAVLHAGAAAAVAGLTVVHLGWLGIAASNGQPVLRPMVSGKKRLPATTRVPRMAPAWFAAVVLFCVGGAAWLVLGWVGK